MDNSSRQAGAQTEITPDMIAAGIKVFLENYPDTGLGDDQDRQMVREIFIAMISRSSTGAE